MVAITRGDYWNTLNTTRKCLLALGLTIMLPVVATLLLLVGSKEALDFIIKTKL